MVNENVVVFNYYALFVNMDGAVVNTHVVSGNAAVFNLVYITLIVLLHIYRYMKGVFSRILKRGFSVQRPMPSTNSI